MEVDNVQSEIILEEHDLDGSIGNHIIISSNVSLKSALLSIKNEDDVSDDMDSVCSENMSSGPLTPEQEDGQGSSEDTYYRVGSGRTYCCTLCNQSFPAKWALQAHKQSELQENGDTKYTCMLLPEYEESASVKKCPTCHKYFESSQLLKAHIKRHPVTKDFSCRICQKMFLQGSHLRNHMTIHTGEKNFSCSVCLKKFKQSGHLLNHMRTHTGEKRFVCSICDKRFTQNIHLKSHMTTHTGEKEHCCIVCDKLFAQSGHLQMHMRTHTGERKYSCPLCSLKFVQSGHLNTHMRRHKTDTALKAT